MAQKVTSDWKETIFREGQRKLRGRGGRGGRRGEGKWRPGDPQFYLGIYFTFLVNPYTVREENLNISTQNKQSCYIYNLNKDHQRMMVDPMLSIVLDLRSFLTAVTTTAVAPTAVISSNLKKS